MNLLQWAILAGIGIGLYLHHRKVMATMATDTAGVLAKIEDLKAAVLSTVLTETEQVKAAIAAEAAKAEPDFAAISAALDTAQANITTAVGGIVPPADEAMTG